MGTNGFLFCQVEPSRFFFFIHQIEKMRRREEIGGWVYSGVKGLV